jgi:hypothetical protein
MEPGELERLSRLKPEHMNVALTLTIRLHADGAMSVEGPVADKAFCKQLLDEAWASIKRQPGPGDIIVPGIDVDSRPKEAYRAL